MKQSYVIRFAAVMSLVPVNHDTNPKWVKLNPETKMNLLDTPNASLSLSATLKFTVLYEKLN